MHPKRSAFEFATKQSLNPTDPPEEDRETNICQCAQACRREVVPSADNTFIIKDRATGKALVLWEGQLRFKEITDGHAGAHWQCSSRYGWLRFRNAVSGGYLADASPTASKCVLGTDLNGDDRARLFVSVASDSGGFRIFMPFKQQLVQLGIEPAMAVPKIMPMGVDGVTLDFVRMEGPTS
jgi:hypothetical protein